MIHSANLARLRYLLHVSSAVGLSFRSQYLEFFRVILYSWLRLSELATPSLRKFLIIGLLDLYSALSRFHLSWVFWFIPGELICMGHISNSTADSLSRTTSCHAGFYIYEFQHYGFLWISSALFHSLIEVLLIISPSYLTLYYSEWVSFFKVLTVFFYKQRSGQYYCATVRGFIYGRSAEMPQSWVSRSVYVGERLIVIHILIGIILIPILSVFIFPLSKLRGRNFL